MRPMHQKVSREINDCVKDGMQMLTPAKMNQPIEITLCGLDLNKCTHLCKMHKTVKQL